MPEPEPIPNAPESAPAATAEAAQPPANDAHSEAEDTPMLDVHPPHEAVHTWKDFCIHIIAIVIGLLIAVGLEQTVEYIHHRLQVAETREALRREHDMNVKLFAVKVDEFHRFTPILQTDLAVFHYLQQHPGAPEQDWPGRLSWYSLTEVHEESAWQTAQQANVLPLLPQAEVRRDTELYRRLQMALRRTEAWLAAIIKSDVPTAMSTSAVRKIGPPDDESN